MEQYSWLPQYANAYLVQEIIDMRIEDLVTIQGQDGPV